MVLTPNSESANVWVTLAGERRTVTTGWLAALAYGPPPPDKGVTVPLCSAVERRYILRAVARNSKSCTAVVGKSINRGAPSGRRFAAPGLTKGVSLSLNLGVSRSKRNPKLNQ
jgi:hypothetical protein